ncbi:YdcH family protein [Uliginosibacterium aquaticum]|uniref:YdcH family protein n=1 Tax=Uliginosibacterium aquaticum TaxID=2731212 RepID=A0ABX2IAQ7_9RHOO|nr:YdcH family protein [Uliginosibacterium aquaticum]NSL53416.1 YdcH family protein [Uliginosibacterium aquaticum]
MPHLLSHDFHVEFPDLAERVDRLRSSQPVFAQKYEQHVALDKDITDAQDGLRALDDFALEDLKKQRLQLKEELYRMLQAA